MAENVGFRFFRHFSLARKCHPSIRPLGVTRQSKSSSLNSHEILDTINPEEGALETILDGMCRGEPLTNKGKRLKVMKILSVTLLPILSLWAFMVYNLSGNIQGKFDIEQTQYAVKFSVEIGMFLDRIQRERDMSVLYLSILGPETKTFLMNEYLLTDQALDHLSDWPVRNDVSTIFQSKESFKKFLNGHRKNMDPRNYDIYVEMDFYSFIIERFIGWMYGAIKESNMASIWKILMAYQKIVTVMEHMGIERALGTVFYVEGGFPTQSVYERYNNRVNIFKANYRSAVLYSQAVDPIYQGGVTASGTNLTAVIESFRSEIQHVMKTDASLTKGQWWFDNMTLYLDTLLIIQQELADLINGQLEEIIQAEEKNLTISACFLVVVFLMCPLVIYSVETLSSQIQKYAQALVHKTKDLSKESKKVNFLLFQMVPKPVAALLGNNQGTSAEYFKYATVMFTDIYGLTHVAKECSAMDVIALLNNIYKAIDQRLDRYNVYKVEAINDSYMVVSGVPNRNGNRHSTEIANLALDLTSMIEQKSQDEFKYNIQLRIGVNSGPCTAGAVGTILPRYTLFGDTISMAATIKNYGLPSKIHISASTYKSLVKHGNYVMSYRGSIAQKDVTFNQTRGATMTYWLVGRVDREGPDGATTGTNNMTATTSSTITSSTITEKTTDAIMKGPYDPYFTGKFGNFDIVRPTSPASSCEVNDPGSEINGQDDAESDNKEATRDQPVISGKSATTEAIAGPGPGMMADSAVDANFDMNETEPTYDSRGGGTCIEKEGDRNAWKSMMESSYNIDDHACNYAQ